MTIRPLAIVRRPLLDQPDKLDTISTGDVLQRLAVLNPEKMKALDRIARAVLREELMMLQH